MSHEWQSIATAPEGVLIETKIDDGAGCRNVQQLRRQGNLWYTGAGGTCAECGQSKAGMYVYYRPTHWRPL